MKTILSLFDFTGAWSYPYHEAGYKVIQIDLKHGDDVMDLTRGWIEMNGPLHGILAAPPCDDFASSGARWFAEKDHDGRTKKSVRLVNHTMDLIMHAVRVNPDLAWWVLENPVGRIARLCPRLKGFGPRYFNPCDYGGWLTPPGDHYNKKSGLWGVFKMPEPKPVEPVIITNSKGQRGSWMWANLGGKSEKTKELRSATPMGFARAFFASNP